MILVNVNKGKVNVGGGVHTALLRHTFVIPMYLANIKLFEKGG